MPVSGAAMSDHPMESGTQATCDAAVQLQRDVPNLRRTGCIGNNTSDGNGLNDIVNVKPLRVIRGEWACNEIPRIIIVFSYLPRICDSVCQKNHLETQGLRVHDLVLMHGRQPPK